MLAVVLTGMGNDGSQGVRLVKQHGGQVLAESEDSSVVYGMPREAAATGCVDRIATLDDIPSAILKCGQFEY
jgi:two-component system chemotaxis response regulator CheB